MARLDRSAPSANAARARRLLSAGALGGHVAAFGVVPVLFAVRGSAAGWSALVAALIALAFLGVGQLVQVRMADAPPHRIMLAWLISYVIRVGVPGAILFVAWANPDRLVGMDRLAVAFGALGVVGGWLIGEIWAFRRLRIPVFDPPADHSGVGR